MTAKYQLFRIFLFGKKCAQCAAYCIQCSLLHLVLEAANGIYLDVNVYGLVVIKHISLCSFFSILLFDKVSWTKA